MVSRIHITVLHWRCITIVTCNIIIRRSYYILCNYFFASTCKKWLTSIQLFIFSSFRRYSSFLILISSNERRDVFCYQFPFHISCYQFPFHLSCYQFPLHLCRQYLAYLSHQHLVHLKDVPIMLSYTSYWSIHYIHELEFLTASVDMI